MRKILKISLIILIGLITTAIVASWAVGTYAERKADLTDVKPTQALQNLVDEYDIDVPVIRRLDCDHMTFRGRGRSSKMAASLSFNSLVDEAKSAESAAIRYKQVGNSQMAKIATADAVERWRHVWRVKAEMECYDIQIQRNSY